MPTSADLPENLRSLPRRQYVEIETTRFEADVKKLAEAIKELLPPDDPAIPKKEDHGNTGGHQPVQNTSNQNVQKPQHENVQNFRGNTNVPVVKPDNYLVFAIITTVLCCLPLGIVSIIHSTKVDNLWNAGQYEQAKTASNQAKQFAIYAAIAGVVVGGIYLIMVAAGAGLGGY
ncbi:MAG: CD225/dispanin family protein [Chitinophagaceae bacterium]|nr:CD225/dispanin family protein [Chitinophagaceae bacterium]